MRADELKHVLSECRALQDGPVLQLGDRAIRRILPADDVQNIGVHLELAGAARLAGQKGLLAPQLFVLRHEGLDVFPAQQQLA